MAISPQTDLLLIKNPLEIDNMNQLTFANEQAQATYFANLPHIRVTDFTYQRRDNVIRYPAHIDSLLEYNYVMYKNNAYSSKYFYAFITRMEYVNDNMTYIYIKNDPYQTWQFDITFKSSFVEREHVNDDTIGLHTVPEGLETGEFITNSTPVNIFEYSSSGSVAGSNSYVVICATDFPETYTGSFNKVINGVYNGLVYLVAIGSTSTEVANKLDEIIQLYATNGKLDYIQSVFMIPKTLLFFNNTTQINTFVIDGHSLSYIKSSNSAYEFIDPVTISINNTINGYTPKNKKLFTREFNNIILTNNTGVDVVMAYEDFVNNTPKFTCLGSITPGCSIKCIPLNFRKISDNNTYNSFNYGISGAKFPICAWTGDTYTNWLTQNAVNNAISLGTNLVQGGIGVGLTMSGNPLGVGMVTNAFTNTIGTLATVYNHSIVPEQTSGNINSGDVTFSAGKSMFTVYPTCIKSEYAKIIDDFWSAYGYKINSYKIPNLSGRRNWNFVKCNGVNIEGYIPQEDLQEIKSMFNNGITLWHNSSTFLDYSQNNDII